MLKATIGNALIAKLHAIYSNFFMHNEYEELFTVSSIAELARKILPTYKAEEGDFELYLNLEFAIRSIIIHNFIRNLKYIPSDNDFFLIYLKKYEMENIKRLVKNKLAGGDMENLLLFKMPSGNFIDADNMRRLSLKQIIVVLKTTEYAPATEVLQEEQNYTKFVKALERVYYSKRRDIILSTGKSNYKKIFDFLGQQSDVFKIVESMRLSLNFGYTYEEAEPLMTHKSHKIKQEDLKKIFDHEGVDSLKDIIPVNYYKKLSVLDTERRLETSFNELHVRIENEISFMENLALKFCKRLALKMFYFDMSLYTQFLAFLTLEDIEIKNLLSIVEGIRFELSKDEIKKNLI